MERYNFKIKVCEECNKEYKPTSASQKRCVECMTEVRLRLQRKHLSQMRLNKGCIPVGTILKCVDCDSEFKFKSFIQIRCKECQKKHKTKQIYKCLQKNPKLKEYKKTAKDNYHFDGNREKTLIRDGYKCSYCNSTDRLHVHHLDGKGLNMVRKNRNNDLDNLITLCNSCHTKAHNGSIEVNL